MSDQPQPCSSPPPLLTWRMHPAARRPLAAALAALVIFAFSVVAAFTFGHSGWGVLSAGVLLFSLNRFFLPSTFVIDESGIAATFPLGVRRLEWKMVRRFEPGPHEVVLSTNVRRTWLNAGRELHIPLGAGKTRALELIRAHLPEKVIVESRSAKGPEDRPAEDAGA